MYDSVPSGASFGSPIQDAQLTYKQVTAMIYNMGGMNIIQAAAGKNCHLKPQHYSAPHSIILLNENAVLLNIMKSCLITVHLLITPIRYADSLCYLFFNL